MTRFAILALVLASAAMTAQQRPPAPPPVEPGTLMSYAPPVYPPEAKKAGIDGVVYLQAAIQPDGTVGELKNFVGPLALRQAAVEAASHWSYTPFKRNGVPAAVETTMAVCFELDRPLPAPCSPESKIGIPVRVSGGVLQGSILWKNTPVYPPIAREQHVSGAVVCHIIIGRNGRVRRIEVISGPEMLRANFVENVNQWVYRPFLVNGEPVEVDTTVTMNIAFGGN